MNKPILKSRELFLLTLSLFFSFFCFGQSTWSIINPSPPWDTYLNVQFIDNQTGWAVGQDGNAIKSVDGGITWNETNDHMASYLRGLFFHDLNNGWIAGSEIYKTSDGGSSWEYRFGMNEYSFKSIYFSSYQTGYAGNSSGIFKTTDGGNNWSLNFEGGWISKIYFINDLLGWAVTRHNILITDDGGEIWSEVIVTALSKEINDFQFLNENIGFIAADNSLLFKTYDGGYTWDTIPMPNSWPDDLMAVHFFNEENGRVFSRNICYITNDGGLTWIEANSPYMTNQSVSFHSEDFGCVVGDYANILQTNDSGYNWGKTDIGHTHHQSSMCLGNNEDIYTTGDEGIIMYSQNSGASWTEQETPTDEDLTDISYINENILWVTGNDGVVLFTDNGGLTWNQKDIGTNKDLNAISFANGQTGCCVGEYSKIFVTHDGGESWNDVSGAQSFTFNDVFFINDNIGWLCGDQGVIKKTEDGGYNWDTLSLPPINYNSFYSLFFINESKGWLGGVGTILSTDDGGQNWYIQIDDLPSPHHNERIYSIHFTDFENGWATGRDGLLLHTKDGGTNWVVHKRLITDDLYDIEFRNPNEGFAIGEKGYVLYTNQGTYLAPHITSQPTDTILCEDSFISFECIAIGDSLNYQWIYGNEEIEGATENTLVFESISNNQGGIFSCKVFNGAGTLESDDFMLSIKPNIEITGHPQDELLYENDTVIFNLAVTGTLPISYQWQKNGVNIAGAINNVYPIYGIQQSDSAYYHCIVSNDCSADTTNAAKLTVLPASSVNEISQSNFFSILPNPVKSNCQLFFDHIIKNGEYEIFAITGIKIKSGKIYQSKSLDLDLSDLLPGIYLIRIETKKVSSTAKFIKD